MRRVLTVIAAFVLVLSLVACGSGVSKIDLEEKFKTKVEANANYECQTSYDNVRVAYTTISSVDVDGDIYTANGIVTVIDNNSNQYVGRVTGVYQYNSKTQEFKKISLDIETPTKTK